MTKEDLLVLLKENLTVSVNLTDARDYYSAYPRVAVEVTLSFDGEIIDSCEDSLSISA